MKAVTGAASVTLLGLVGVTAAPATQRPTAAPPKAPAGHLDRAQAATAYGNLPLRFEANVGQTDPQASFLARSAGGTLFLTGTEAVLSIPRPAKSDLAGPVLPGADPKAPTAAGTDVVRMRPLDTNPNVRPVGTDRLAGVTNYLTGNDQSKWHTDVPAFGAVRYPAIYPGIDLVFHGKQNALEYDYQVAPGADPATIAVGFDTPGDVILDPNGDLVLHNPSGDVRQPRPILYQDIDGTRRPVPGGFALHGNDRVGFTVGAYDHTRPLVIDPIVQFTTFLGGTGTGNGDKPTGLAVDAAGNVFVAGSTDSADFPTKGTQLSPAGARKMFVSKLTPDGSALIYSTYLGVGGELGGGLAVDATGSAIVTGSTNRADFPTTPNAFSTVCGTPTDASGNPNVNCNGFQRHTIVSKLAPDGASLLYSTFIGGSGPDNFTNPLAVDAEGIYVATSTKSSDYPTTAGAFDRFCGTGTTGTPPAPDGTCNTPSTFNDGIAGSDPADLTRFLSTAAEFRPNDVGKAITGMNIQAGTTIVGNPQQNAIVLSKPATASGTGLTFTIVNREAATNDVVVVRLDPRRSGQASLAYSTYFGGSGSEQANGVAVDPTSPGTVYVGGTTRSGDFPTTTNAFQRTCGAAPTPGATCDSQKVFVAKFDTKASGNSSLKWSTYLGGHSDENGGAVASDANGSVFVTGSTASAGFPTRNPLQDTLRGASDAFVTKIAADGTALIYSTFLGGTGGDNAVAIAVDTSGSAHITGGGSTGFPQVGGTIQASTSGPFAAKLTPSGTGLVYSVLLADPDPNGRSGAGPVAVDTAGNTYVAGNTFDPQFPSKAGSFTAGTRSGGDVWVLKLTPGLMPVVAGLAPADGPIGGGTQVVISGVRFTGTTQVTFGGVPATSFTVDSDTQITAISPPRPSGVALGSTVFVAVTTPLGASLNVKQGDFLYGVGLHTGSCIDPCPAPGAMITLKTGKVLLTNGKRSELYDPATGTWKVTGACAACGNQDFFTNRNSNATLLPDGKVLWTGGVVDDSTAGSFLYDPATETWSPTKNAAGTVTTMIVPRYGHTATLLPNGKVLVAGGFTLLNVQTATAELYDPATGTWTATGSMSTPRTYHTATVIDPAIGGCGSNCGKVLVAFGKNPSSFLTVNTAELYDPATGTWGGGTATLGVGALGATAIQLHDGKVVVVGGGDTTGYGTNGRTSTDLYDPAAGPNGSWGQSAPLLTERSVNPAAVLLPNGGVLITGSNDVYNCCDIPAGYPPPVAELRDPVTGRWTQVAQLPADNSSAVALLPPGPLSACATRCGTVLALDSGGAQIYVPQPQVTGLDVTSGPGGTRITITGTGLASTTSVSFGGTDAAGLTPDPLTPDTKLVVIAPAHGGGPVDLVVNSPGGSSAPIRFTFTVPTPGNHGYWEVASDGGIFAFGNAQFYGSTGALRLAKPIVGMASTPPGKGYWLVASDGGIFSFGDAGFFGSTGALALAKPIVGMSSTPSGRGYWLVASDGGIFAFGDAAFKGSTGALSLAKPVVGMASTPTGSGYWLVASDGGIFAFGDAGFFGSTGALTLAKPIVGMSATPSGKGYWLSASDGGIFAFGDAGFFGSTGALTLAKPVVGLAHTPS